MATSEAEFEQAVGVGEQGPGPSEQEEEEAGATMTLVEHLEELRRRILICVVAVVLGSIVSFVFREQILHVLTLPLPPDSVGLKTGPGTQYSLVVTGVGEAFTVFLKLSVAAGMCLAAPVILYELWAFVAPGLTRRERRWAGPFVSVGLVLFLAGLGVGYFTLRFPVQWLINFGRGDFLELVTADNYFTFIAFFMLAFGIVFELPLLLTFLAQIGTLSSRTLRRKRAVALVVLWILSTFLTPGSDPYSPIVLGTTMTVLYELSIIMIRITRK
jgi:sec-independent protein translocase protein TatC